ncbi:hypothetical protein C9374_006697 [Naegleria lovaniensis]|uniref:Uncharacterized protein n=1 Tax=Naegleria lovaniensis TaxID=51637 RepID=A0AA88GMK5_NAELO|nr:uncharacterized protein C9374_006697 [Naegleria lovaniensis]KAG2379580.1 hypothetical protein C9374_006697 [Naegleria lovaniensis]
MASEVAEQIVPSFNEGAGSKSILQQEDELDWGALMSPNGLEHELMSYSPLKKLLSAIIKKVSSHDNRFSQMNEKLENANAFAKDLNDRLNNVTELVSASDQKIDKVLEEQANIKEMIMKKENTSTDINLLEEKHNDSEKKLMEQIMKVEKELEGMRNDIKVLNEKHQDSINNLDKVVSRKMKELENVKPQSSSPPKPLERTNSKQTSINKDVVATSRSSTPRNQNERPNSSTARNNQVANRTDTPESQSSTPTSLLSTLKDLNVVSKPNEEKTVQLFDAGSDDDASTIQSVILSLPKHGKLAQFVDTQSNQSGTDNEETNTSTKSVINFAPAAVVDPSHRINVATEANVQDVVDPFVYNVYDVKNDVDRAHVSRVKGVLVTQLNDLQRELEIAKSKESDDINKVLDEMRNIREQVESIDRKLQAADRLKQKKKTSRTSTPSERNRSASQEPIEDREGLLSVDLEQGRNVMVYIPKNDQSNAVSDSINELLGKIDYLENKLAETNDRIAALENRSPTPLDVNHSTPIQAQETSSSPAVQTSNTLDTEEEGATLKDLKKLEKKIMYYITTHDMAGDLNNQVQEIQKQLESLEAKLDQKCDALTTPSYQQFKDIEDMVLRKVDRDEFHSIVEKLKAETDKATNQRPLSPEDKSDKMLKFEGTFDQSDLKRIRDSINTLAAQVQQLTKMKADKIEVFKELSEKKEAIDRLDQTKSDANIVARKAEREYVDSLFNKMKKDLENMIGLTNSHTADMLAKDLEFLKKLIEDKADIDELKRIKDFLTQSFDTKVDKDGEGLASSQAFKCLSCNRAMKGMKLKPNALNFDNFVSHLPPPKPKVNPRKQFLSESLNAKSSVQIPSSVLDTSQRFGRSSVEHLPELRKSSTNNSQ